MERQVLDSWLAFRVYTPTRSHALEVEALKRAYSLGSGIFWASKLPETVRFGAVSWTRSCLVTG